MEVFFHLDCPAPAGVFGSTEQVAAMASSAGEMLYLDTAASQGSLFLGPEIRAAQNALGQMPSGTVFTRQPWARWLPASGAGPVSAPCARGRLKGSQPDLRVAVDPHEAPQDEAFSPGARRPGGVGRLPAGRAALPTFTRRR